MAITGDTSSAKRVSGQAKVRIAQAQQAGGFRRRGPDFPEIEEREVIGAHVRAPASYLGVHFPWRAGLRAILWDAFQRAVFIRRTWSGRSF